MNNQPTAAEKKKTPSLFTTLGDGRVIHYTRTIVMGILNATPDSFYAASRSAALDSGLTKAEEMLAAGADILDIGGESTRPGADPVSAEEECMRVIPLIRKVRSAFPQAIISVDTYRAETAEKALHSGADIINDISAMTFDEQMATVAVRAKAPVILMHMQGSPKNMQTKPHYNDVVQEVKQYLNERVNYAMAQGLRRDQLIIDPGIGFGKTDAHNLALFKHLDALTALDLPVLLAASRKGTIGNILGNVEPKDRLEGTLATTAQAVSCGTHLVRVHDVVENVRFIRMMEAIRTCP